MDYFSNDINMNLLKNHIMKDPLLDWYNIQDESDYQKDEESEYKRYILKESNKNIIIDDHKDTERCCGLFNKRPPSRKL